MFRDEKLESRFAHTQRNAANALDVADVGLVLDNSSVDRPFQYVETWRQGKLVEGSAHPIGV